MMREDIAGCRGDGVIWTGRTYLDLNQPDPSKIHLGDIAVALSRLHRFGGRTIRPYTVAEHSVWVMQKVRADLKRQWQKDDGAKPLKTPDPFPAMRVALLHDAAEAYVGDMVRPLRQMLPDFHGIEKRVRDAIFQRFGVAHADTYADLVQRADNVALATEVRDICWVHEPWPDLPSPDPETILPLESVKAAEALFLEQANMLGFG